MTKPTNEEIEAAIKATDYKYFGDYELSENQWEAVYVLLAAAKELINARKRILELEVDLELLQETGGYGV